MGLAIVLAASAIGFIQSARPTAPAASLAHRSDVERTYAGIPQRGKTLGRSTAPVTMIVYVDPQCPYCGEWERVAMPELVARYVKSGTLRIVVRGLHFVGPDSERALRLLDAAALQNRFFQAAGLLYSSQGEENTGWVTDGYLRSLAYSIRGADPQRLLDNRQTIAVETTMRADQQKAARDGVVSTPWIELGPNGGRPRHVELARLDAAAVAPAIARIVDGAAQ
ncbi:MAG TPA: thioredoxin domain-containing protein [Gaiellaceae bacterium]